MYVFILYIRRVIDLSETFKQILQVQVSEFIICWEVTIDKVVHAVACGAVICASRA